MKFKLTSFMLAIFSLIGVGIVALSEGENKPFFNILPYLVVFILVPAYGAYSAWHRQRKGLLVALFFFASQSIRGIGGDSGFPYLPPISLGFPFGDFADGQGYLVDFFAIFVTLVLAWLLWELAFTDRVGK